MNKELLIYSGLLTVGLGAGFGGGYLLARKRYQAFADAEIADVKERYAKIAAEKPTLEELAAEKGYVIPEAPSAKDLGYIPGESNPTNGSTFVEVPGDVTRVRTEYIDVEAEKEQRQYEEARAEVNVFDTESDEVAFQQSELHPYLISVGSWHDPDADTQEKVTLIYYEADQTLADEADTIIQDIEGLIGSKALTFFGPRSRAEDDDIVYVRNIPTGSDYEIHRKKGSYREIVLGE